MGGRASDMWVDYYDGVKSQSDHSRAMGEDVRGVGQLEMSDSKGREEASSNPMSGASLYADRTPRTR